jgi:hypothetical protein
MVAPTWCYLSSYNIFVSAEILARCEVVTELAPDATALYDRAWDEVLAR